MQIKTILVATDFSEPAARAIETAVEFAKKFNAKLIVLHAYKVEIPMASPMVAGGYVLPDGFFEQLGQHARTRVEETASEIRTRGVDAVGIAVEQSPALAIVDEAKEQNADLIIMGTRGLTGIKHVALGSVAERVVRTAPCAVLTIGAPKSK
ncbi:MAG TPA: universal stress protein [Deltaproteobacteria bacterium]|nr:universal stress protein [Deltaproteobacteria bacterium]